MEDEVSIRRLTPRQRRCGANRSDRGPTAKLDVLTRRSVRGRGEQARTFVHVSSFKDTRLTAKALVQDSLTNSQDVSVAIGLLPCAGRAPAGTCDGIDPTQELGTVLFAGPYTPQAVPGSTTLVQNYTVTVPSDFPSGPALLSVPHFVLVGVRACVRLSRGTELTQRD